MVLFLLLPLLLLALLDGVAFLFLVILQRLDFLIVALLELGPLRRLVHLLAAPPQLSIRNSCRRSKGQSLATR